VALGSRAGLAIVPIFYWGVVMRIVHEERFLRRELRGYEAYTRTTSYRIVPFVW
jgi:protein-S-isoprenylcysteine O-methyltransferase Ste14